MASLKSLFTGGSTPAPPTEPVSAPGDAASPQTVGSPESLLISVRNIEKSYPVGNGRSYVLRRVTSTSAPVSSFR